jgi:hypothetical protein
LILIMPLRCLELADFLDIADYKSEQDPISWCWQTALF